MFGWLKKQEKLDRRWAFGALAAFIAMLVVNWLAGSTELLGGWDTAAVSDAYPNLFAPLGLTFAIWGVIYALLGMFFFRLFEVWKPKKKALPNGVLNQVTVLFTISSVLNMAWLFAWQYNIIWLSVLLMIGLLVSLILINEKISNSVIDQKEAWMVKVPFGVYFGWITVATIANISTWLVSIGWDRFGLSEGFWMVAVLLVGAVIAVVAMMRHSNWAYGAAVVWAYAGILAKHLSATGWNGRWPSVLAALYIILPVLIALSLYITRSHFNLASLKLKRD